MKLSEKISKPVIIAAIAGIAVIIGVIVGVAANREESYRSIQVYEIEGTAWVTREGAGKMEVYANMQLQGNDRVNTESGSYLQLKMDEDKYLLLEPETSIQLEASGNAQNSKTKIILEEGGVVNKIKNKLSKGSSYEVETPNATMAVRGTTYRITVKRNENGRLESEVEVQDGSVKCIVHMINADGTVSEKEVMLEAGMKTVIQGTPEGADYVSEPQEFTYDAYENQVLYFIGYWNSVSGNDTGNESGGEPVNDNVTVEEPEKEPNKDMSLQKESEKLSEEESKKDEVLDVKPNNMTTPVNEQESSSGSGTSSGSDTGSGSDTSSGSDTGSGSDAGSGSDTNSESDAGSGSDTNSGSDTGSGSDTNSGSDTGSGSDTNSGSDTVTQTTYTVTFSYNGSTFAVQSVTGGNTASKPVLCPTQSGAWCLDGNEFEFAAAIMADTQLEWTAK